MPRFWASVAGLMTIACGGQSSTPAQPSPAVEVLELRRQTAHFRIFAGQAPDATVALAADRLEEQYARVLADFGISDVSMVTVSIWQDEAAYFSVLERYFGERYQATGYITGRDELRVLAVPQLGVNVVHEFCHAVSLYVNSSFANNPRWLWETVALYENGELVQPRTLDYMAHGTYPTLQELNAGPNASRRVYEVGYVLGEFIVARWGRPALLRLIQTNADLQGVLGVSPPAFEEAWHAWVRQHYLDQEPALQVSELEHFRTSALQDLGTRALQHSGTSALQHFATSVLVVQSQRCTQIWNA